MAITEQQTVEQAPEPKPVTRQRAPAWTNANQLRRTAPMLRLIAEIWAIPLVKKIAMSVDGAGIYVWVLLPIDDRESQYGIFAAERTYLNATKIHNYDLHVTVESRVPPSIVVNYELAGYETILER